MKFNFKDLLNKVKKKDKNNDNAVTEQDGSEESAAQMGAKLFSKVGDLFNYEPQKERVLNQEDFNAAGDVYYASVSALYKVAERLLWLVLAIFIVFSLVTNYREITYNNFFYLLRDFSTAADSQASNYQVLSYDSNSRQKFALYRGGLVSAAPSNVSIFTAGGRRTLRSNNDYYSPNVICCDKYVLVYDTGSSSFSVYNSFSKVYNKKLESPITDACFDNDGAFALATRKNDAQSLIYIYNKDIKELYAEIGDNRFIFDMSLDLSNDAFAALYFEDGGGIGTTTVCLYSDISAKTKEEKELVGEFPLACSFLDNRKLVVITNRSIRLYNENFDEKKVFEFEEANVTAFDASADGAAVVVSSGVPKRIIAFDKKGELLYNSDIGENISDVSVNEKFVFLQTISGVMRIDAKGDDEPEFLPSDNGEMLIYSEDTAMVCGEAKAEYLVFGKKR